MKPHVRVHDLLVGARQEAEVVRLVARRDALIRRRCRARSPATFFADDAEATSRRATCAVVSTARSSSGRWYSCTDDRCVRGDRRRRAAHVARRERAGELDSVPVAEAMAPVDAGGVRVASQVRRLAGAERAVDRGGDDAERALAAAQVARRARERRTSSVGSIVVAARARRDRSSRASTPSDVPPAMRPVSFPAPRMRDAPGMSTPSGARPASCGSRPMRRE